MGDCVDVRVSNNLKEELPWAVYKRLRIISTLKVKNEVAIGPVTGRDSHSYKSGTQRFFREGCTGKAMIRH